MKLDATDLRYITSDEFRVLTAVRFHPYVYACPQTNIFCTGGNGIQEPRSCANRPYRADLRAAQRRCE